MSDPNVGYYHSIETLGTVDDGGIRLVLFLSGCRMRCKFCHNPETWTQAGKLITVAEVLEELEHYQSFIELSGGGLTVSGGEPLLQWRFVRELFRTCGQSGYHRALDTSGYCRNGCFDPVLAETDLVLFSIKVMDDTRHRELTGVSNAPILANLRKALEAPVDVVLRYVLIPGINDRPEDISAMVQFLLPFRDCVFVDVLPYHRMGLAKWDALGLDCELKDVPEPDEKSIESVKERFRQAGIPLHHEQTILSSV